MPVAEDVIVIDRPSAEVFALLDDATRAPEWMESCQSLQAISPAPKGVGTTLDYRYRQGGDIGQMQGTVTAYAPGKSLSMQFSDAKFTVKLSFELTPTAAGTEVRHSIDIVPGSALGKLMGPLIAAGNRKQVASNLARLKGLVER